MSNESPAVSSARVGGSSEPVTAQSGGKVQAGVREEQRIPALDGLRGIAILMVFFFHMRPPLGKSAIADAWNLLLSPLWCGVDLFFVLSGFLITGILLNTKSHQHYFLYFYARRTLRIFPLYFGVLAGLFVLLPLLSKLSLPLFEKVIGTEYYKQLWNNQVWLWLYIQNFLQARGQHQLPGLGHFWSLAIEEQFYLVWPFLVYFLSQRNMFRLSLLIVLLGIPLRWFLLEQGYDPWAVRHLTYARIDSLSAGACIAIMLRENSSEQIRRLVVVLTGGSAAGLSLLLWMVPTASTSTHEVTTWGYTLFACFFSGLVLAIAKNWIPTLANRIFTGRVLTGFGTLSYGLYVFHWPIIHGCHAVAARLPKSILTQYPLGVHIFECVLALGVSLGVSMLSWWAYESRLLSLKRYFSYSGKR